MMPNLFAIAWIALLGGGAASCSRACTDEAAATTNVNSTIRSTNPESYVDVQRIWLTRRPIPVCWEPSASKFKKEKRWVEQAIKVVLETPTAVRFIGYGETVARWPTCTDDSMGIRVTVAATRPRSEIGQQWTPDPYSENRKERPTLMTLDFTLGGPYYVYCAKDKRHCLEVISVHEFMHAIGFLHEHLREDTPEDCKKTFGHEGDDSGIQPVRFSAEYDPYSIMTYCTSIYRKPVKLSADDIEAVDHFYRYQ